MRVHREQLHRGHTEFLEIVNCGRATQARIGAAQFLRQFTPKFAESLHMDFVDHGLVQRNDRSFVILPVKSGIDHYRFRHAPRVVTKVLRQIFLLIADHVTKHFICPAHLSRDSFCVRIKQKLRAVETQAALRIVWTGNAEPVQLSRPRVGQEHVPDLISLFVDRNANVFFSRFDAVEQTELNAGSVLRENCEVDALPRPSGTQRIRKTEKRPYRSHKRAAHLSGIDHILAMTNGGTR